tara:strand:+ start:6845 stop:8569 length:1725 start_codon:yes stop_codon:yes gene_type:complete
MYIQAQQTEPVFTTQAIPEASEVSINGTSLSPIPFVSIRREEYKSGSFSIGGVFVVTLQGMIYGDSFDATVTALNNLTNLLDTHSTSGFFQNINIKCGNTFIIKDGIGTLISANFDEGPQRNWMNVIPYNIQLEIHEHKKDGTLSVPVVPAHTTLATKYGLRTGQVSTDKSSGIRSLSENFDINLDDTMYYIEEVAGFSNKHVVVGFSLRVTGTSSMTSFHSTYGLAGLNKVLTKRLNAYAHDGFSSLLNDQNTSINLPATFDASNGKLRQLNYSFDELNNTAGIDGEIVFFANSNLASNALVTYDINHDTNIESADNSFTVQGSIKGFPDDDFVSVTTGQDNGILNSFNDFQDQAMQNAENALNNMFNTQNRFSATLINKVKNKDFMNSLLGVGELDFNNVPQLNHSQADADGNHNANSLDQVLNKYRLVSKTLSRNYNDHSIDFNIKYANNRFKLANAYWADVNIDHERPANKLVEHVAPGRGYPIIQNVRCKNMESYNITITAQFEPRANPHSLENQANVKDLMDATATNLGCQTWVVVTDSETLGNNGSYRRTKKYTRPFPLAVDNTDSL